MGRRGPPIEFQQLMPFTPMVKKLVLINVVVWFVGTVILEQFFLHQPYITLYLGLTPHLVIFKYFAWQPITYLFIHVTNPLHIIFNMLLLWWVGSQLESLWGPKFFLLFYFVSGVGAAILYMAAALAYSIFKGDPSGLLTPVVGASAALFGLLMAYAMYFGEQIVYFMFFFPMKAKYFVAVLAAVEVVLVLNNGLVQGKVASLAHVGGLLTGYIFLKIWPRIGGGRGGGTRVKKPRSSKLKLVVNNEEFNEPGRPKYWN